MEVNIGEIKDRKGGEIRFHLEEDWSHIRFDGLLLRYVSPIVLDGRATFTGEFFLVRGTAETEIEATCARCLRPIRVPITARLDERFKRASHVHEEDSADNQQTGEEDQGHEDVERFRGLTIHLDDVVQENLLVSLPIKPLCREGCRGLCFQCGQDLNDGDCGCVVDDIDPRMSKLRQLLDHGDQL